MRRVFSFLLGGIAGGLVGAAIALLLAPVSGTDMRNKLCERFQSMRDEVQAAAASRRIDLEEQLAQLRAPHKPTQ